ncbi:hypothetical protein ABZW11_15990 [Nonomuraea sp. NPDC004580]|uniref:hypothetical protein n=1 Tax=Nonomuraea sp. NPDC004580 TaxID=3154552 RepID=UPI0033A7742D
MDLEDERRLDQLIRRLETWAVFAREPGVTASVQAALQRHCRIDHAALLIFPSGLDDLRASLRMRGFEILRTCPSTVVRSRLAERYDLDLPVLIAYAVRAAGGPALEVFVPEHGPGIGRVAARERERNEETHLALEVIRPDEIVVRGLGRLLTSVLGFAPDGGGFNPYEDGSRGGRTVLYFGRPVAWPRRVELACAGHYPHVLRSHLDRTPALVADG